MKKMVGFFLIIVFIAITAGCTTPIPPPIDDQARIQAEVLQWVAGFENAWESNQVETILQFYHYPHVQVDFPSGYYVVFPTEEEFRNFLDLFLQVIEVIENKLTSITFLKISSGEVIFEAIERAKTIENGVENESNWTVRITLISSGGAWKLGVYEVINQF